MRAARYLHIPPWELAQKSVFWRNAALAAESVENEVEIHLINKNR